MALAVAHVDKRGCDFSPVAKFERALAQPAAGDHRNSIGSAAVDLNEGDEALAVFAEGIVDSEFDEAQHRQPDTEHLSGAEVPVCSFGIAEIFVERFHTSGQIEVVSSQPSAFSLTSSSSHRE